MPRSKQGTRCIRQVETAPRPDTESDNTSSSDDEYLYVLGNSTYSKAPMVTVGINDIPVTVMIDTGASANIIDEDSFEEIQKHCTI